MSKPETAFVLAAGFGTRMRPLTDHTPKPLVELNGKPLIDHVLDRLADAGVKRAVVNVHHLAEQIETHLATRERPEIVISDERSQILDTGGGVAKALESLGDGCFFVHNSDSVWVEGAQATLEAMIARWDPEEMDALLLLAVAHNALGYSGDGDFLMDTNGQLSRRAEGAIAPFVFAGVSIANRAMFEGTSAEPFSLNKLWDKAIENDRLFGIRHDGIWMHVGDPKALADAETILKDGDGRA